MSFFKIGKVYRRHDIVGKDGQLFRTHTTLQKAIDDDGCPPGRLIGRTRVWTGGELNKYLNSRSTAKIALPKGVGGAEANAKRKRKPHQADRHA